MYPFQMASRNSFQVETEADSQDLEHKIKEAKCIFNSILKLSLSVNLYNFDTTYVLFKENEA